MEQRVKVKNERIKLMVFSINIRIVHVQTFSDSKQYRISFNRGSMV